MQRLPATALLASQLALLLATLGALLGGCLPPQATADFGLGTQRIQGTLRTSAPAPLPGGGLVVVYAYHHQFVTQPDGSPILSATARVIQPSADGHFSFAMPSDVLRVVVLFVAPGHLTEVFRFSRQLGVGDVTYQADLQPMAGWRDHYYTYLSPQLQNLIVEPRYRLPPQEQQRLAAWLQVQNERLGTEAGQGRPGAPRG